MALPGSPKQDRNGVRSALDLERKYDFSSLVGIKKAIKLNDVGLTKTNKILEEFIEATVSDIGDLQKQMDGKIETWFYEGEPTLENEPANQWPVTSYAEHQGDLYYDKLTGYAYRFLLEGDSYVWMKLSDSDVTEALAIANAASDTADSKRRVFVDVPVPPYDNGDLWFYNGEIFICQISKGEGEIYETKDFITATKYTDDTEAHKVGDELTVVKGTVLTIQENHEMFKVEIKTTVSGIGSDLEVAKTTIEANTNEIDLRVRKDGVIGAINLTEEAAKIQASKIELEGAVTMTALDSNLQDTISGHGAQLSVLNNQISAKVWQQDIDDTVDDISIGSRNLIRQKDIVNFQGTTDSSAFTESGTITHTSAHAHGGFSFDSISCYEIDTEYVLSGYVTVTTGPVGNFYIYNGKKHVFKSFSIDGVKSGSPLDSGVTAFNAILDDGKKHYFELHFVTASEIPADTSTYYTYIQLGKYFNSEVAYTISGLKLEKGNKATDWSPAPEDIDGEITNLSTRYSELLIDLDGFKATVGSTYATKENLENEMGLVSNQYSQLVIDLNGLRTTVVSEYTPLDTFNALDIGVTNLLRYMNEYIEDNKYSITATKNDYITYTKGRVQLEAGQTYTFSCNTDGVWKTSTNEDTVEAFLLLDSEYTTFYRIDANPCTFTATVSGLYTLRLDVNQNGATHTFWNIQIEKGNRATDWKQNLFDTEDEVLSVKTIATQNADKFKWLVKSGTSSTDFTLTDRMAELTADIVSLNANVKINGDMIVDGAITAKKIAIGDFTNLAVINPDNYNPYPHTVTEDDSGVKWFQFGSDTTLGYYTIYMNTMSNQATFKKGDKYLFRGLVRASQTTSVRVCLRALYTAGGYINMASAFYDSVTTEAQYIEIPFEVVSLPVKPVKYYSLFLETRNTKLGILYARELSVHQMAGNVLIADGSITAKKLYVEDLSALNATIGGWKIATKYISNDALDSDGYVRRAFIQSMSAHEAEDTWVFSVQKSKELGDYEGTFSSVWRVLGSGDMYSEGLISVGGYVYAGEHISTGGYVYAGEHISTGDYISAENYILAQNFIRTKSYLRVDDVLKVYGGTEDGSYSFIQGKLSLGTTSYNNDYTLLVSGDAKISGDLNLLGTFLGNVSTLGDVVTSEGASLNSLNSRFKWYSSSYASTSHEYVLMDAGFYAIVLIDSLSATVRSKPSLAILYADGTGNGWVNFWQGTGSELYDVQYNSGRLRMVLEESRYLSMGYINLKQ